MFAIISYLKFLKNSKNQYAVHSPFVFKFLTKGLYKRTNRQLFNVFLKTRNNLLKNKKYFDISDFGAGSRIYKDQKRTVAQLTKNVSISRKKAKILFKIIHYFQPNSILELGTCLGLGTITMQLASKNAKIETVEGCENIAKIAQENFNNNQLKNIEVHQLKFEKYLENLPKDKKFDAIFIDGNHTYQATISYFNSLLSNVTNDSLMIFDDIYWNKDMEKAWQEIKNHQKVTVSIDLFYFGLIFFRKEQEKQHFIIRT